MNKRIVTRVVDTAGAAITTIIQKDACEIHWITVNAETLNTQGLIQIFDGFDVNGKLQWQLEPGYSRQNCFCPAMICDQGLTVYNDANISSYTIAYSGISWPEEQK